MRLTRAAVFAAVLVATLPLFGCGDESPPVDAALPSVVGQRLDLAKEQLGDAGFKNVESYDAVEDRTQWDDSNWTVTEQDPSPGTIKNNVKIKLGVRHKDDDDVEDETSIASSPDPEPDPAPEPAADPYDIKGDRCFRDSIGGLHYTGSIANRSSSSKSFEITVEFVADNGVRLDDGIDYVSDVEPGQVAAWETVGISEYNNRFSCKIKDVQWL